MCGFAVSKVSPHLLEPGPGTGPQKSCLLVGPRHALGPELGNNRQGQFSPHSGGVCLCRDTWAFQYIPPGPWGYLDWGSLCVHVFHLQTKRALPAHSSPFSFPPLESRVYRQRNAALHSSRLNGAHDHSPGRSLPFLAQPDRPGPAQRDTGTQPATRAPAGGLIASGVDWLPGFEP